MNFEQLFLIIAIKIAILRVLSHIRRIFYVRHALRRRPAVFDAAASLSGKYLDGCIILVSKRHSGQRHYFHFDHVILAVVD